MYLAKESPIIFYSFDMEKNKYIYRFADKTKHCLANTVTRVKSFGQPYGSIICEKHFLSKAFKQTSSK